MFSASPADYVTAAGGSTPSITGLNDILAAIQPTRGTSTDRSQPSSARVPAGLEGLADRLAIDDFAARDLSERIRERQSIYTQHLAELEQARANAIAIRRDWRNPLDDRPYLGDPDLLRELHRIDAETRAERLACWRDLDALRRLLPELCLSQRASYRRYQLIAPPPTTEPTRPQNLPGVTHDA